VRKKTLLAAVGNCNVGVAAILADVGVATIEFHRWLTIEQISWGSGWGGGDAGGGLIIAGLTKQWIHSQHPEANLAHCGAASSQPLRMRVLQAKNEQRYRSHAPHARTATNYFTASRHLYREHSFLRN
jgi:hypothetical protein